MDVTSANVMPFGPSVEWMSVAIASGVLPALRSVQICFPIATMSESSPDGT